MYDPYGLLGFGIDAGANAEGGAYWVSAGGTVSVGGGLFFNGWHPSLGGFFSRGAFARFFHHSASSAKSTSCKSDNNWAAGAYGGGGLGVFLTNANKVSDLSGPFKTYSFNIGWGIANLNLQFSIGKNSSGKTIWLANYGGPVGVPTGGGYGGSLSRIETNTSTTN